MPMRVASLGSGSSGNSYYVESPEGAVLIDAGLSGKKVLENIAVAGGDPALVRGIIVTHDHIDHIRGAGILQRKHGWKLWMTRGTRDAAGESLGNVQVEVVDASGGLSVAGLKFSFHPTPHDGAEPVVVTVERNGRRCGIYTDLGHVFPGLAEHLAGLDFVFLESNYDPGMLAGNRRYPPGLKARIRGSGGHLSNGEAAELLFGLRGERLRRIVLSHLSKENNTPDTAKNSLLRRFGPRLKECGIKVGVAPRDLAMRLCPVGG